MFIRSKPFSNGTRQRIQIVENIRDGGKVRQKLIRHIGVSYDSSEEVKLRQYGEELIVKIKEERKSQSNQGSLFKPGELPKKGRPKRKNIEDILPVSKVKLEDVEEIDRIIDGIHEVGGFAYTNMGFDTLLKHKRDKDILKDIVLSRMASPDSKRGLQKLLSDSFDKDHNLDAIYRVMDKLHEQIPKMKEVCFNSTLSLIPGEEVNLVFFDVTTLYFESEQVDELRAYGYSKDHRFNTTQVVLALATNEDGLPLGYELFSGNTAEVKTLLKAIDSWSTYFKVKDVCFVADRAMFSRDNLKALDSSGYNYIVAAKLRALNKDTKAKILSNESYSPTVIDRNLSWVSDIEYEGKRLITSYKSSRAKNDARNRQAILHKIEKTIGIKGSTKKLISNSGVKKYTKTKDTITEIDECKIEEDALWDGLHGVITNNRKITPLEAILKYSRLWVIEESFRINKHNLKMRPIYHYTPKRIKSHIAICYMSFAILRNIEYKVSLTQKISPKRIVELLLGVQTSILQHKVTKDLYKLPGLFKKEARKIYKTFNIKRKPDAQIYIK